MLQKLSLSVFMEQASYLKVPKELATGKKRCEEHQQLLLRLLFYSQMPFRETWTERFLLSKRVIHWIAWDLAGRPSQYLSGDNFYLWLENTNRAWNWPK